MSTFSDPAATFIAWLQSSEDTESALLSWFACGAGRGREETAPSDFILSALPVDGSGAALRWELANRMAAVLRQHPTLQPPHPLAEEAMTHLLLTASRLASPEPLREPLWNAWFALRRENLRPSAQLAAALLTALVYHPSRDEEAVKLWFRLLRGERDPILGGAPEYGMHALFLTPSAEGDGTPDFDLTGQGLRLLARHYHETDRRTRLQKLRRKIRQFAALWQISDPMAFFQMAHRAKWHELEKDSLHKRDHGWPLLALRHLFYDFGNISDQRRCVVWHEALKVVEKILGADFTSVRLCGGKYRQITFAAGSSSILDLFLKQVSKISLHAERSDWSESELHAHLEKTLINWVQDLNGDTVPLEVFASSCGQAAGVAMHQ